MRKKVLVVADSLGCGGAEKSLLAFLSSLNPSEVAVTLMLSARGGVFECLVPKCIRIVDLPTLSGIRKGISQMRYSFALRKWSKSKHHGAELYWQNVGRFIPSLSMLYDVAIAYHQGFPTYFVVKKVEAKKKVAWVNTDLNYAGYNPEFNRPFYERLNKVICVSEDQKIYLSNNGYPNFKNAIVIYDIINPYMVRKLATEKIQISIEDYTISQKLALCTVGRMVKAKNYFLAVESAKILRDRGVDFIWYFIGDGDERKNIEVLIQKYHLENYILLTGLQANPYPWISACDIYVQTSSFEGFGITIAEAKILNKPIVSTNFTVISNQLSHENNGLITEMNPQSIADSILRLVNDKNLCDRIISNLKNQTNNTMSSETIKIRELLNND